MQLPLILERSSNDPLQAQIYEQCRRAILAGVLAGGQRLPSTRDLSRSLGVSRATVALAYERLLAEGYLEARHGSGTFVSRVAPDTQIPEARRSRSAARRINQTNAAGQIGLSRWGAAAALAERVVSDATPGMIHLSRWRPDLTYFPNRDWGRLLARAAAAGAPELFDYAGESFGYAPLRAALARYLGAARAVHCSPEQIVIVGGSQQALDLCARVLLNAGESVALENPCYQGARQAFETLGAHIVPLPVDDHGATFQNLESLSVRAAYLTPSHQFPTGVSLSLPRRLELIELARRKGFVIIEDDYDSEYRYEGRPLPSLQGLSDGAQVVYVGTFSKVLFPSLRLGYMVVPPPLVHAFSKAKWIIDRQCAYLEQHALAGFIESGGLARHIRRMRKIYGQRRAALVESLDQHFGARVKRTREASGMHVLARFDTGLSTTEIIRRAQAQGVTLAGSQPYYLQDAPNAEFVLGFAAVPEKALREAIRRLAAVVC